jgi:hypothetical protein
MLGDLTFSLDETLKKNIGIQKPKKKVTKRQVIKKTVVGKSDKQISSQYIEDALVNSNITTKTLVKNISKNDQSAWDDIEINFDDDNRNEEMDKFLMKSNKRSNILQASPVHVTSRELKYDDGVPTIRNKLKDLEYDEEEVHVRKTPKKIKKTLKKGDDIKKKGPGRPRNKPLKEAPERKGIATEPTDEDDDIEVMYAMPILFKKIVSFFKLLAAAQIQIIFRPTEIIMYAQDHHEKSRIRVRIDAAKLNHYYCRRVINIGVNCKDMERIFNKVDKEYNSIIILSTTGHTQKRITMILKTEMQIDENHMIGLVGTYNHITNEDDFIDDNYMIQFTLPCKYFKKTINDIKSIASDMSITQEDGNSPLEIEYISKNKKIKSNHVVKNKKKINLISNVDEIAFRVDIKVDYIKPISSAQIADNITIMVDENKAFMTRATIDDGAIEIKTLTEIIDNRPQSK